MFQIHTQRLRLLPLSLPQLILMAEHRNKLENLLGLHPSQFEVSEGPAFMTLFQDALEQYQIPQLQVSEEDYAWKTHWLIIHKQQNRGIGGIGCYGPLIKRGRHDRYFIDRDYENQGLCE